MVLSMACRRPESPARLHQETLAGFVRVFQLMLHECEDSEVHGVVVFIGGIELFPIE